MMNNDDEEEDDDNDDDEDDDYDDDDEDDYDDNDYDDDYDDDDYDGDDGQCWRPPLPSTSHNGTHGPKKKVVVKTILQKYSYMFEYQDIVEEHQSLNGINVSDLML